MRPSLLDSAFMLMCHQVLGFLATGELPRKLGSGAPSAMPYRVYEASDGAFMLATASDAQFVRLCTMLEIASLAQDPRFRTMSARLASREELDAILAERFRQRPIEEWLRRFAEANIPAGPVNDIKQSLALPVVAERELFVAPESLHWAGGMPLLRLPIDADGSGVMQAPPKLGEHTAAVLREAGFDEAAIARLTAR